MTCACRLDHACRFYGPALSDAFPSATVWAVPGLLEGKGLPFPFFSQYTAGMRARSKVLGECSCRERLLCACASRHLPAGRCLDAASAKPWACTLHFRDPRQTAAAAIISARRCCAPLPVHTCCTHRPGPSCAAGEDPLPPELEGQLDWEVLTAPFFIEAAVVLPQHGALLLADTGAPRDSRCSSRSARPALRLVHWALREGQSRGCL